MLDSGRTDELIREIEASGVTQDEKNFLVQAARRHNVFNYRAIAEYYAQATQEMQRLMEHSALVIIDVDDAIALGYAKLNGTIRDMIGEDGGDADALQQVVHDRGEADALRLVLGEEPGCGLVYILVRAGIRERSISSLITKMNSRMSI